MPVDKFGRMSDTKTKDTGVSLTYINDNYVRSDGKTPLTGSLDMRGNTIYNVADPVNPQDVVTKVYVDKMDNLNSTFSFRDGGYYAKGDIYLGKNKLGGLRKPLQDGEAANKKNEVDTTKNLFINENDNIAIGSNIDMEGNKIFSLPEPEQDNEPATKKYVDDLQTQHIDKRGNVKFDRNINMNFHNIRNLGLPKDEADAVPRKFVQDVVKEVSPFLKKNGNYQTSTSIDMKFNKLFNLLKPTDLYDAATKDYVDYVTKEIKDYVDYATKEIKEKLEKKKQIIAVHANYCGPLEEGDYPFKFGGNSLENCEIKISKEIKGLISGFVIPHPGYIKKTICEGVAYINLNTAADDIINSLNENDINKFKLHYKKEDFKNDFSYELKHILRFDEYSDRPILNKKNSFFEIIKIEKKYHDFIPPGSYTFEEHERLRNLPRVIKTVLIEKFILIQVEVSREKTQEIHEVRLVMQISSNDKVRIEEGETLNIRISNFPDDLFLDNYISFNVFKPAVMVLFSKLNFNFTFLIELDPL